MKLALPRAWSRAVQRYLLRFEPSSLARVLWAVPVVALISYYYAFMGSVGTFHDVPQQLDYYDRMVEGFRAGHLYIQTLPSPQLLAKANPLAPENVRLGVWDSSLYKGHYYFYWGPVPGLGMWAYKAIVGTHERVTDQWPTVILMCGRLWAGAVLLLSIASRVRLRQPAWVSTLAIAAFGLANPLPFIVARPHIYECSLTGGQCFIFWGLVWAFWGIEKPNWRGRCFTLASICWGLAIGCRATAFVAVPLLMLVCAGFAWYRSDRSFGKLVTSCLALGIPVAGVCCAYGTYNYLRFDHVTDFGVAHMITLQPFYGKAAYVFPNVFSYLLAPVRWSCRFPFVNILAYRPLATFIHWPLGYQSFERVGGILITASWCWLSLLCVWQIGRAIRSHVQARQPAPSGLTSHELWALLCSGAMILSMIPVISLWEASMRYVGDAVGGIVLAACIGVFWLLRQTYALRRRPLGLLARTLVIALGVQTCVIGALCAVTTYDDPLKTLNPTLFHKFDDTLSFCGTSH